MINSEANEFKFIIDKLTYLAPLYSLQAFSDTIKRIISQKQPFIYKFDKLHDPLHQFSLFIDLLNGVSIDITEQNAFFLGHIGDELEIKELSQATDSFRQVKLTLDNIFDILNELGMLNISYPQVIDFVSTNWKLLSERKELLHLPFSILNEIFSKNSDISLDFNFVLQIIKENLVNENQIYESEYISLFKYCDISSFTSYQINKMIDFTFIDSSQKAILQKILPNLLKISCEKRPNNDSFTSSKIINPNNEHKKVTIKTLLKNQNVPSEKSSNSNILKTENSLSLEEIPYPSSGIKGSRKGKPSPEPPQPSNFVDIEYEPGFELNGIILMLQNYYQRPRWKDEVVIKCSESTKSYLKFKIFDFDKDNYWDNFDGESCKIDTAWIIVGFPNYSLRLTYYTIAPKNLKKNFRPPKSWKIYGSNDIDYFDESDLISYVKEAPTMNDPDRLNTFEIKNKPKPYSYFKFVMLENYAPKKIDAGDFNISALEFFGILTHL